MMPLKIVVSEAEPMDIMLAQLFLKLMQRINNDIVLVESIDGWDGTNVRIVVKKKEEEIIEKIFDSIEEVERQYSSPGTIIPQIVSQDEI